MADTPQHYSIIIIGGGPIGLACALEAQKAKIPYLILEKGALTNSIYNYPNTMTFFSTSERLEIGKIPFVSNNSKPSRGEALEYYRRVVQSNQLHIHLFEEVLKVTRAKNPPAAKDRKALRSNIPLSVFNISTNKFTYTANHIIIATGFYDIPYLLNVPGEDLPKVKHYYDDPHFYAFQQVMVVGASNSAIDAALETWRKGAQVTVVVRGAELGKRVKYWVKPDMENRIKEGSIKIYYNSTIKEIAAHKVLIQTPGGDVSIPNQWVLAMTGFQPNLEFLKRMGIKLSKDEVRKPFYDEMTHETNVPDIYLAGVICGGMNTHRLFIENSRVHATNIIRNIRKKYKKQG